jgi:hypothetical protein
MYNTIIFGDEDEDEGDTQAVEEDLMDDGQGSGGPAFTVIIVEAHL